MQPVLVDPSSPAVAMGDATVMAHVVALACASAAQAMVAPSVPSVVMATMRPHGTRATWYVLVCRGLFWQGEGAVWPGSCLDTSLVLGAGSFPMPMPMLPCLQSATEHVGAAQGQRIPAVFAARGAGCCMTIAALVRAKWDQGTAADGRGDCVLGAGT